MPRGKVISAPPSAITQQSQVRAFFSATGAESGYSSEGGIYLVFIRVTDCYKEAGCLEGEIIPYRDVSFELKAGDEVYFEYDRDPENSIQLFTAKNVKRIDYSMPCLTGKYTLKLTSVFSYAVAGLAGYLLGRRVKNKGRGVN